jgi:hypothetical protein
LPIAAKLNDHAELDKIQVFTPFSMNRKDLPIDAHGGAGDKLLIDLLPQPDILPDT